MPMGARRVMITVLVAFLIGWLRPEERGSLMSTAVPATFGFLILVSVFSGLPVVSVIALIFAINGAMIADLLLSSADEADVGVR